MELEGLWIFLQISNAIVIWSQANSFQTHTLSVVNIHLGFYPPYYT